MKKVKVFSRHLLGLGAFLGSTLLMQAQADLAMVDVSSYESPVAKTEAISKVKSHSTDAIKQLSTHIKESVVYPEHIKDLGINGTVVVEINLDKDGKIVNSQLVERVTGSLDQAVIQSLRTFTKVKTAESKYQGVNTVHIPIRFAK